MFGKTPRRVRSGWSRDQTHRQLTYVSKLSMIKPLKRVKMADAMDPERKKLILSAISLSLQEFDDSSSSSSDEELNILERLRPHLERRKRRRRTVPRWSNSDFRETVEDVLGSVARKLMRSYPGLGMQHFDDPAPSPSGSRARKRRRETEDLSALSSAILESRRIAEDNKNKRHAESIERKDCLLGKMDAFLDLLSKK